MLDIKLNAKFLSNIPNDGMFKTANISLAPLYECKDNNVRKLLLYSVSYL